LTNTRASAGKLAANATYKGGGASLWRGRSRNGEANSSAITNSTPLNKRLAVCGRHVRRLLASHPMASSMPHTPNAAQNGISAADECHSPPRIPG
jgi:hypothetical protein